MYLIISIALISAAAISYEILLMRLISIIQWHHFAYMVISLALLGYGASGTFLTLAKDALLRNFSKAYLTNAALFGIFSIVGFLLAEYVRFNALEIVWDARQFIRLFFMYLFLMIPFFCAANCIGLAFMKFKHRIGRIYLFDLVGAGLGAIGIVIILYRIFPASCLGVIAALALIAASVATLDKDLGRKYAFAAGFLACAVAAFFLWSYSPHELEVSQYKGLPKALLIPETEIIEERSSPLGQIAVVKSLGIPFRHAPGLSVMSKAEVPEQLGIFIDADSLTAITRFTGDQKELAYTDALTQALPYHLLVSPDVLILGSGGGADVLEAMHFNAKSVDAVELNPQIAELVTDTYAEFAGNIFAREGITQYVADARRFVSSIADTYDLIQVALLDSFAASSAGLYALNESYLYTVEAFEEYFERLKPGGILAITRWFKIPPRDSLKLFATAIDALKDSGVSNPGLRLAMIRSWKTSTLLVKNGDFTADEIKTIQEFCKKRAFDTAYFPGIDEKQANQFNILNEPYLFDGALALLSDARADYVERYKYHITPATDDKPYFFNFFKWSTLPEIIKLRGMGGAPLMEWGYPILIATLVQAVALSILLILVPLIKLGSGEQRPRSKARVFFYFTCLGLAFLFVEIAFIQRFILFLGHPLYAIAVVIAAFLIFAGLGSGASRWVYLHLGRRTVLIAVLAIVTISLIYVKFMPDIFAMFMWMDDGYRIAISIALIAPLAFFMGMPFPIGLTLAGEMNTSLIPWAWGINGCASVISPMIATLIAIHFGFSAVITAAVVFYVLAALTLRSIENARQQVGGGCTQNS
ncbi:MAG: SAM-dependent methyltransferase [Pseudomonadota bacterium]